jgi:3-mercaptopropionate dioxygenase
MPSFEELRRLVVEMTRLVDATRDEARLLDTGASLMKDLIRRDDWLPEELSRTHPQYYQQYLLYGDPLDRFSLVSFVWGPGQRTPIHNHTVWGLIGMLRGAECGQHFSRGERGLVPEGEEVRLEQGDIDIVSPTRGDIHQVRNAYADRASISIHLYGGNIGRIQRNVFDAETGREKPFVSGYSNAMVPNLWAPQTST